MIFIICFLNEFTFHNTQGWSLQAPIYLYFYATYIQSIWKGQNIKQLQTISTVCTMFCFPSERHVWNFCWSSGQMVKPIVFNALLY